MAEQGNKSEEQGNKIDDQRIKSPEQRKRGSSELDPKVFSVAPVPLQAASGCSRIGQPTFAARQAVTQMRR
jgi:hypothetical protein